MAGASADDDADALGSLGVDVEAIRATVDASFGVGSFDGADPARGGRRGEPRFDAAARKVLELTVREGIARRDRQFGPEHLVLGILRSGDTDALAVIREHVDPSDLRTRVVGLLDQAA